MLRWTSLMVFTFVLALLITGQSYKEDISDFLPLDNEQQKAFIEYQNSSSARRIFVIFQTPDNSCQTAVDLFCDVLDRVDSAQTINYLSEDDPEVMQDVINTFYDRIPYSLTMYDYARIDSMTKEPDFVARQLENDKQLLMLPSVGMISLQVQHDPLSLFTSVMERMKVDAFKDHNSSMQANTTMLLIDSPYGASETEHNAKLVSMLQNICDSVSSEISDVTVRLTGGPVIAVGNAQQIKEDSLISITFAVILILLLLWLAFHNIRNLLLIALSIGWGWLFAMGCLTLVHNDVSIIVIGISSVILGIAVNYPLHLIAHLSHTSDIRSALKEVIVPLVVGNITTVGAFLALLPQKSVALRDLGLFSSFLLVGTIIFVLLWLPHLVQRTPQTTQHVFSKVGDIQLENKSWIVWSVVVLTIILGYFSFQTSFDADLRNINYMTDEQRNDMRNLEQVSSFNSGASDIKKWNEWRISKGAELCQQLRKEGAKLGFANDSFDDFYKLISTAPADETESLTSAVVSNLSDNFNYIGWACGFIVFFFLWFSLGSIELALISFLPMAISWVWILGLMALFGIQFNVVNIILATFIFGRGDDYTIFMTEGCQYEYAYRRKMLSSYKQSIVISALIMFIGIGVLIIAKHPALRSLAQVTIVGMFVVVLMAWLVPPLIFRWMVYEKNGRERRRPVTLRNLVMKRSDNQFLVVADRYRYRGIDVSAPVNRRLRYWRKNPAELNGLSKGDMITDKGWGETALLIALQNPHRHFTVNIADDERTAVARHAYEGITNNITIVRRNRDERKN